MADGVEEAATEALEAEAEREEAEAAAASTQAAATAVAASQAAVALAKEESAIAMQRASETIEKTHGEISWLKNQTAETYNSLSGMAKRQESQEAAINMIAEQQAKILEGLQLLTQKPSTQEQRAETVNPKNEEGADHQKTQSEAEAEVKKPKRVFL